MRYGYKASAEQFGPAELLALSLETRLDDFDRKGWHNRVRVGGRPGIEYVGMVNRADDADDRVVVRNVSVADLIGRSVIVHRYPDDYRTQPEGGSGDRIACGVIKAS